MVQIILSGRSSGERGTQVLELCMAMNDNHICRLLHSQFQSQLSFPLSSDAKSPDEIVLKNYLHHG